MKRLALTTAIVLGLAAPALASDQLAASLGVAPGTYSTAELIQLRTALENDDAIYANFVRADDGSSVSADTVTMIQLRTAEQNDDNIQAGFFRNGGSEVVSTQSFGGISAGQAQLAATLGVDAGDYTVAELIELREALESNDNIRAASLKM